MKRLAAGFGFLLLSVHAAAPHYFLTTMAGYSAPISAPVAVNQPPVANLVAYDGKGVLYYSNPNHVWRLNSNGTETLVAGSYSAAAVFTEGELAIDAPLAGIVDLKFDSLGNLFIASAAASKLYQVTPNGTIATFAGSGVFAGNSVPPVGPGIPANSLSVPVQAVAIDSKNNVYLKAGGFGGPPNPCWVIMSFPPDGSSSALVGSGPVSAECPTSGTGNIGISGSHMFVNSTPTVVNMCAPSCTASAQSYELTLPGGFGQLAAALPVNLGPAITIAPSGSIYGFPGPSGVMEIDPVSYNISTLPNSGPVSGGKSLAINPVTGDVAIATLGGSVSLLTILSGTYLAVACNSPIFSGDNGPAVLATMRQRNLTADFSGNVYLADSGNNRIRKITPSGIIATVAGNGKLGVPLTNLAALLQQIDPLGMAVDGAGNLYFINTTPAQNGTVPSLIPGMICKIDHNGILSIVAGGGTAPIANGAQGTGVAISPSQLVVDAAGDLFFDTGYQLWEMNTSGVISLVAGSGNPVAIVLAGTPALNAPFGLISAVAVDHSGTIYIGDSQHQVIWRIDSHGNLQTVAGVDVLQGSSNSRPIVAGPALNTNIGVPHDIQVDAQGNIYFDTANGSGNPQVIFVDTSGNLAPIGGGGAAVATSSGDGGDAALGTFQQIYGMALDGSGNLYVSDVNAIREMSPFNPSNPPPFLSAGGIVGAGGSFPAVQSISTGTQASIFGANFVSAANAHTLQPSDLVNGIVPTNLDGVCVNFGSSPAAILGIYPNQIHVQVGTVPAGPVTVQVTVNCGAAQAVTSNLAAVAVASASPEFYSFKPDPIGGHNPIAAVNALTQAYIGPPGLLQGVTFVPAKPGDIVQAYATGFGPTTPSYGLGVIPGAAGTLNSAYSLTLGGVPIPQASIQYAGISPCCAGFYQVDFTVPQGTPSGALPLVITIAGVPSPPEAYIQVQ